MFQIRAPHLHSSCCYFLPARHWLFPLVLAVTDNTTVNIHVQTSICSYLMVSSRDGIARSKAIFREFWSTCRHLTLLQAGQAGFISLHCWKQTFEQTLPWRADPAPGSHHAEDTGQAQTFYTKHPLLPSFLAPPAPWRPHINAVSRLALWSSTVQENFLWCSVSIPSYGVATRHVRHWTRGICLVWRRTLIFNFTEFPFKFQ